MQSWIYGSALSKAEILVCVLHVACQWCVMCVPVRMCMCVWRAIVIPVQNLTKYPFQCPQAVRKLWAKLLGLLAWRNSHSFLAKENESLHALLIIQNATAATAHLQLSLCSVLLGEKKIYIYIYIYYIYIRQTIADSMRHCKMNSFPQKQKLMQPMHSLWHKRSFRYIQFQKRFENSRRLKSKTRKQEKGRESSPN